MLWSGDVSGVQSDPRWETTKRNTLRATFDDDADAYDRVRPVAPGYVFDDAVDLATLPPGSSVVEIGQGTGQATLQLVPLGRSRDPVPQIGRPAQAGGPPRRARNPMGHP